MMQGRARDQSGGSTSSAAGGPPTPGRGPALMEQISWCEEDNHFPTISPNDWELDLSALEVGPLIPSSTGSCCRAHEGFCAQTSPGMMRFA